MRLGSFKTQAAMKKTLFSFLAAFLCVLPSCQRQELDPETVSDTVTIHFTTGPIGTRTVLGEPTDGSYPTLWQEGDQLTFNLLSANTDADAVSVTPTVSQDGRSASFSAAVPEAAANDVFYAMCPASANLARDNDNKTWVLEVPTTQTPSVHSPDPSSQLVWAWKEFTTLPESVSLQFQHITAYGCLSLENLALGDATIQSVSLVANGGLFGRYFFYIDDIDDYLMGDLRANRTSNSVTLITSSATGIWFSCFPLDVSGSTLKVTVTTDKGTFTKTVSVPEGKSFKAGKVTKIKVDMSDIPLFNPVIYQRVNDMSEIGPDDDVIIAALNGQNYYAINTTQNRNNRGSAEVTVENDRIVDPGDAVEIFKVESGASAGTWRFRATKRAGYLYAGSPTASSSNSLKTSADGSDVSDNFDRRSSWYVSIADGIATVQSDLVSVAPNVATLMQLNSGNNNYACYVPNAFQNFPYPSVYKKVSN